MKVENTSRKTLLANNCISADKFWTRFLGLMGKKELLYGNALLLKPCNSIHMMFMKFPLDIIFIDRSGKVVYMIENINPWRVSRVITHAHSVIEFPVGTISSSSTQIGDTIIFT